ncbi:GNAT family N-acetyltransferase [Streptomyces sp. NPDC088745]|uniref:GNAT family N-acetyltransferase n=1 Tax=Streptomyces sp. NPDC088745 TaxID=3365884 RepID=UPI0037F4A104
MPELLTARLRLRPLRDADLDALTELNADPEVVRDEWAARGHGIFTVEVRESGEFTGRAGAVRQRLSCRERRFGGRGAQAGHAVGAGDGGAGAWSAGAGVRAHE